MTRDLTDDRLALGLGAVLSLSAAARLLPVSDADARSWLRARGLVSDLDGRAVVVWQRVCAALAAGAGPDDDGGTPPVGPLPRVKLAPIH